MKTSSRRSIQISEASRHNLKSISLTLVSPGINLIRGPIGSGKTSLLESLENEGGYRLSLILPNSDREDLRITRAQELKVQGLPVTISASMPALSGSVSESLRVSSILKSLLLNCNIYICSDCGSPISPDSPDRIESFISEHTGQVSQISALLAPIAENGIANRKLAAYQNFLINEVPATAEELKRAASSAQVEVIIDQITPEMLSSFAVRQSLTLAKRLGSQGIVIRVLDQFGVTLKKKSFFKFGECSKCGKAAPAPREYLTALRQGEEHALFQAALDSRIDQISLRSILNDPIGDLNNKIVDSTSKLLEQLKKIVTQARELGLGHLTLSRKVSTLSSGEIDRLGILRVLSLGLTHALYLLDRPAAHLSENQTRQIAKLLSEFRKSETLFIADNSTPIGTIADQLIDLGPGSGAQGGNLVNSSESIQVSQQELTPAKAYPKAVETLRINVPAVYQLAAKEISIGLKTINYIIGESGSGKSLLLEFICNYFDTAPPSENRPKFNRITLVPNQIRTGVTVTTALGIDQPLAQLISHTEVARSMGLSGAILKKSIRSSEFSSTERQIRYRGLTLEQLCRMTVGQMYQFFDKVSKIRKPLQSLIELGLSEISLDRLVSELSSGEQQLLTVGKMLYPTPSDSLILLDDPGAGLLEAESKRLMHFIEKLAAHGNTVVVASSKAATANRSDFKIQL